MRKLMMVVSVFISMLMAPAFAQQVDVAFGGGSLASSGTNFNGGQIQPTESGGAFVGFSGDVLFHGNLGVQGEVNWRGNQGSYGGLYPYRPIFWDFNAIYARRFSKFLGAEALGGIGGESIRFYSGAVNCDQFGNCTNYVSSNHFLADIGAGIRLYPYGSFFVRPEVRMYLVNNNQEFSSNFPVRYGVSIGYTFGGSK
ncbi:MAG TPA: hypothetical protein VKA07_03145 [Candidatus Sulfotelmatobacter sp.]|nr:hypothetical protein [Candidatus Sulfotelmatobacter sp.]